MSPGPIPARHFAATSRRCQCSSVPGVTILSLPKTHPYSSCRMLVLMKHPTESVVSSYVKARDLVRNHKRHGQWLERAGIRDSLMRPVPVAGLLELPQGVQKAGLVPDQRAVQ
jgi:hypothetical protein